MVENCPFVAGLIYQYIIDEDINQAAVARNIGMSKQTLCNKLQGRSAITAEEYLAICRELKVSPDKFDRPSAA